MRTAVAVFGFALLGLTGCGDVKPEIRAEGVAVSGTVKLPAGVAPKDLTVTFQPQQQSLPASAKLAADGSFTTKLEPGKYSYYFPEDVNSRVPAFKAIPEKFRSASNDHTVEVEAGAKLALEVR